MPAWEQMRQSLRDWMYIAKRTEDTLAAMTAERDQLRQRAEAAEAKLAAVPIDAKRKVQP